MFEREREREIHLLLLLGVLHAYMLCYVGVPRRFISLELTHLSLYILYCQCIVYTRNNILQFAWRWAIVDCRLQSDYGARQL